MNEQEQRQQVVAELKTWLGTPYLPQAKVKGHGADCLTLVAGVFEACGLVEVLPIPYYSFEWQLHTDEERYLDGFGGNKGMLNYCKEVSGRAPLPADIILFKFGHCFSHAAIVVDWPIIIHSYCGRICGYEDVLRSYSLTKIYEFPALRGQPRPRKIMTLKAWTG